MKKKIELLFYSRISSPVSTYAQGERWEKVAEKTVKFLNSDLGEAYPDAFYYLKAKVKSGHKYFAGSFADPGQWDDARFKDILDPLDASGKADYNGDRKPGN